MRNPLVEALSGKKTHLSFHTPAHNGGIVIDSRLDVTELSYSDNLLSANGVILESEREVAKAYGVENVIYSTAGATALIHTVIRALKGKGSFLVYGEAHKSVFNALRINDVNAVLYRGSDLNGALIKSGAGVVICTSPNYFGRVLPLAEIRDICKRNGAILVVDASHGAHFAFSSKLPSSATKYADLVIHSQHKVMPTLTGGASLCYTEEYGKELRRAFCEIHTTSPNYLVMLSIESAVKEYSERGEELYNSVIKEIEAFTLKCSGKPFRVIPTDDLTRLVVAVDGEGERVASFLESKGIYPELVYGNELVFIVTPNNYIYLDTLYDSLDEAEYLLEKDKIDFPKLKEYVELHLGGEVEEIALKDAVGRISYREVGLYPPGVPIIASGEKITLEQVNFLIKYESSVFGLENGCLLVVK